MFHTCILNFALHCVSELKEMSVNLTDNIKCRKLPVPFSICLQIFPISVRVIPRDSREGSRKPQEQNIPEYHFVTNVIGAAVDELEMQREAQNGESQGSNHPCACDFATARV